MSFNKFFTIYSISLLSINLFAQEPLSDSYKIEILIFEQLEIIGDENLESQNLNINDMNTIKLLDKSEIVLNEKSIMKSFDFVKNKFSLDEVSIDRENTDKKDTTKIEQSYTRIDESIWFEKKMNLEQLDNIFRRLDRRKDYKILHKQAWIQPALSKENSPYIHEVFNNNGILIKLYKSRYLHLDVLAYLDGNLETDNNPKIINKIKLDALKKLIPDEVQSYNIKIDPKIFKLDDFIHQYSNAEKTLFDSPIRFNKVKYLLKEERRIFKNEVHYFDHPKIGVIISVYDSSL